LRYVVVAELLVRTEALAAFEALIARHAALSRAEPGCRLFEAAFDTEHPERVLLYEVYDHAEAYAAHRASPHYARFREVAPAMLVPRDGQIFHRRSVMRSCGRRHSE
jgi:quinol monooxygenase YgiN